MCREVVTPAYGLLARAIFQSIERLAATDSKHGDRLRLESYAYFVTVISDRSDGVAVLQWHVRQATAAKQRAMQAYVQQQLEHGKFWKLIEFSMVRFCKACLVSQLRGISVCMLLLHSLSTNQSQIHDAGKYCALS